MQDLQPGLQVRSTGPGQGTTLAPRAVEPAENIERRLIPGASKVSGEGLREQRIVGHRIEQGHR